MREIKFRAWIINKIDDEPQMVYDDEKIYCGYHCGVFGDFKHNGRDRIYMQFTGIKDKNGKEIYEGDIVICTQTDNDKDYREGKGFIEWNDWMVAWCFARQSKLEQEFWHREGMQGASGRWWEVIGNIYENKELLSV